ncbi:putative O-methyltransferase [Cladorrhinum sp. PSN332]|nr:putative O-methyltransferase [Cladorrhinum sp. PSN332]
MSTLTEQENTNILTLSSSIQAKTQELATYFASRSLALPTFSPSPPVADSQNSFNADPAYRNLQGTLRTLLSDLNLLIDGPAESIRQISLRPHETGAFQIAIEFNMFTIVPVSGESIPLSEIASKAGLDENRTGRILRLLATNRFFVEPKPDHFAHTVFSAEVARDEDSRALLGLACGELFQAASESYRGIKEFLQVAAVGGGPAEMKNDATHCAWFVKFGVPMYEYYLQNPDKAERFAKAMAGFGKSESSVAAVVDLFDWKGQVREGTVVDVGGGNGHVSLELAGAFPHLSFVVQDQNEDMLDQGRKTAEEQNLGGRVSFAKADFFEPQPFKRASAFYLRQCTHNWRDEEVVTIFKSLVPGLEGSDPETPLLINECVLPQLGAVPRYSERDVRIRDFAMMINGGSKERTRGDFDALLKEADPRYEIVNVHDNGASMSLLEIYLKE